MTYQKFRDSGLTVGDDVMVTSQIEDVQRAMITGVGIKYDPETGEVEARITYRLHLSGISGSCEVRFIELLSNRRDMLSTVVDS
jgi:hypothetical protein